MQYEWAVLAALTQLNNPTRPKIVEATGISPQRVAKAIEQLRTLPGVDVQWEGPKKTGHYVIQHWGDFNENLKHKMTTVDLTCFKNQKIIKCYRRRSPKPPSESHMWENYKRSLKLEGLCPSGRLNQPPSPEEREKLRRELKSQYTSARSTPPHTANDAG